MYFIYFFSTFVWFGLTYLMHKLNNFNTKIARNFISAMHATSVVIFYLFDFQPRFLFYITSGYYLADGIVESYYLIKTNRLYNLSILIHHVISWMATYKLTDQIDLFGSKYFLGAFFTIELSNYPVYLVYHLKTIGYNNNTVIKLLTVLEIISYIILRVYMCGIKLYESYVFGLFPLHLILSCGFIYVISIIWLYGMFLQLFGKSDVRKKIEK